MGLGENFASGTVEEYDSTRFCKQFLRPNNDFRLSRHVVGLNVELRLLLILFSNPSGLDYENKITFILHVRAQ